MNIFPILRRGAGVEAAEGHRRAEHLRALSAGVSTSVPKDASPPREHARRRGLPADEVIEIADTPIVNPERV